MQVRHATTTTMAIDEGDDYDDCDASDDDVTLLIRRCTCLVLAPERGLELGKCLGG